MSARSRHQFAAAVRRDPVDLALACHLIGAEAGPETDPRQTMATLDALASDAAPLIAARRTGRPGRTRSEPVEGGGTMFGLDPRAAAEVLREILGVRAGFGGAETDFDDVRSSLLPDVLRRRRGLPILLSIVWLEVARRLDVPAYAVGLPGHVIVAVGTVRENVLVDPFAGGRLITVHDAAAKVRAAGMAFTRGQLAPMSSADLLARVLANIRNLAARTDVPQTRLWAVELSLLLPRHPASLRRERGELRVRLGDFLRGAADLATFADAVESVEPATAAAARQAAAAARARLN